MAREVYIVLHVNMVFLLRRTLGSPSEIFCSLKKVLIVIKNKI